MRLRLPIVYTVNREKGYVTAKFKDRELDLFEYVNARSPLSVKHVIVNPRRMRLSHYLTAAQCAPNDTFDEVIGKKIARRRLLRQFYTDLIDELRNLIKQVDNARAGLNIQLDDIKTKKYNLLDELHDIYDFPEKYKTNSPKNKI